MERRPRRRRPVALDARDRGELGDKVIRSTGAVCIVCNKWPAKSKSVQTCRMCTPKRSKYGCKPVRDPVNGFFQSTGEHARFLQLQMWEHAGLLENLKRQVQHDLSVNGHRVCTYISDYEYDVIDIPGRRKGEHVVEDFKGHATDLFRLKAKLLRAVEGVDITIVTARDLGR